MVMKTKIDLDSENILIGYTPIDSADVQPGDVVFDVQPDLPFGNYRWNGERFDPVNLGRAWHTPEGPDAWYAMFRALEYLQREHSDINFPEPTKEFMRYYYNSFRRTGDPKPPARGS